tara:strand:+ start:499 stop:930 length:432 start_codon:yes stop_codon:yes gene_type:complete
MKYRIVSLLFALPLLAAAQSNIDVIDQRQEAFSQIESLTKKVNKTLNGSATDWNLLQTQSETLHNSSHSLTNLFPAGSKQGSKAKEDVWQKPDQFNQLLQKMDEGFETLYLASQAQDIKQAQQGLKTAEQTCRSCHRSYRSRW